MNLATLGEKEGERKKKLWSMEQGSVGRLATLENSQKFFVIWLKLKAKKAVKAHIRENYFCLRFYVL